MTLICSGATDDDSFQPIQLIATTSVSIGLMSATASSVPLVFGPNLTVNDDSSIADDFDYYVGIDPGASNVGVAVSCNEKNSSAVSLAAGLSGSIWTGNHRSVSNAGAVAVYVKELVKILNTLRSIPNSRVTICIENQPCISSGMTIDIRLKIHNIQGATIATGMLYGYKVIMADPKDVKKFYMWTYQGGYNGNKRWAIDMCRKVFPAWHARLDGAYRTNDHCMDAKLTAEYLKLKIRLGATSIGNVTAQSTKDPQTQPSSSSAEAESFCASVCNFECYEQDSSTIGTSTATGRSERSDGVSPGAKRRLEGPDVDSASQRPRTDLSG